MDEVIRKLWCTECWNNFRPLLRIPQDKWTIATIICPDCGFSGSIVGSVKDSRITWNNGDSEDV